MADDSGTPIDTGVAHIARVYDFWLGGTSNFPADREAAGRVIEAYPDIRVSVRAQRAFLGRAVHFLAAEAGIRQFLDIGTGLPSAGNTHEVAQRASQQARIVYVDNDPIVLTHARALLTSGPDGQTAYVDADIRDTDQILAEAADYSRLVQTQESQQIAGALGVLTILGLPVSTALAILQVLGDADPVHLVIALAAALAATGAALTPRYGRLVLSSLRGGAGQR